MVGQEPKLFHNTIEYNIKYNRQFSDEEMQNAAEISNARQFIEKDEFENKKSNEDDNKKDDVDETGTGYKRSVGMKGSKLSGGQKQRVAIARTVIRKPKVYFFDEATSALDTQSEKLVQDALNKLAEQSTSLTIAHRISTIIDSDVIFVIKEGKVIEQGTYDSLMSKRGEFFVLNKE